MGSFAASNMVRSIFITGSPRLMYVKIKAQAHPDANLTSRNSL